MLNEIGEEVANAIFSDKLDERSFQLGVSLRESDWDEFDAADAVYVNVGTSPAGALWDPCVLTYAQSPDPIEREDAIGDVLLQLAEA